jgi:molybdopterin-containing oxidoreductase family membrane subunit
VSTGIGTWGLKKKQLVGPGISNLFGGGIGHAGTLISAVLLLFRRWRMAINRSAEAMTIFSVIQAVYFQLYIRHGWHIVLPFQINLDLWVNFNSLTLGCICNFDVLISITCFLVD